MLLKRVQKLQCCVLCCCGIPVGCHVNVKTSLCCTNCACKCVAVVHGCTHQSAYGVCDCNMQISQHRTGGRIVSNRTRPRDELPMQTLPHQSWRTAPSSWKSSQSVALAAANSSYSISSGPLLTPVPSWASGGTGTLAALACCTKLR